MMRLPQDDETARTVAALFVQPKGVYANLPHVEPWGLPGRDAMEYDGPYPVVAHPPCSRWGRYWSGGPSAKIKRKLGDDGGCFRSALVSVRRWGGVLEHPEASKAWRKFVIWLPPRWGGWVAAGDGIGWTCCVEQGHYGHRARKATWLYACGVKDLPSMTWGASKSQVKLDQGFHSAEERRKYIKCGPIGRMGKRERAATPVEFRNILLEIARSAKGIEC